MASEMERMGAGGTTIKKYERVTQLGPDVFYHIKIYSLTNKRWGSSHQDPFGMAMGVSCSTNYFWFPTSGGAYHDEEARLESELKKVTLDGETVWVGMCCVCEKFVIVKGHEDYEGLGE
jgi:hypothetical protein